ncbi:glutaredoxin 3 [Sphingosinicella sp.]|uniref:glutaredoxin 3 n=1 Tax=Sphingosinicella sp. TaxID=1917971 RepID=UPI0040378CB9
MARVEIYSKAFCSFCTRAKHLLEARGASVEEYDITMGGPDRATMIQRAGGRTTVPQIFIDGRHIGGCDDLCALDARGQLEPLLRGR